jgi:hypothetical protein
MAARRLTCIDGVKELLEVDMSPVFEKLNLKEHSEIVVVSAPPSFEAWASILFERLP